MCFTQAQEAKPRHMTWGDLTSVDPNSCNVQLAMELGLSPYKFTYKDNEQTFSLEMDHCQRMRIGFWDSAFEEGKDLPAEKLNM